MKYSVGKMNPYRYRGYRYDEEIDLYYLNSRFYNSNIGRFINADGLLGQQGNILGHNMYAYTQNNPIMFVDPSGYLWKPFQKIRDAFKGTIGAISKKVSRTVNSFVEGVTGFVDNFKRGIKSWWKAEQVEVGLSMTIASLWMKYAIPTGAFVSSLSVSGILTGLAITTGVFVIVAVVVYVIIKGAQYITEDPNPIPLGGK